MIDKTIPHYTLIMRRPEGMPVPEPALPPGFSFSLYRPGDEDAWADIETAAGEFDVPAKALAYFEGEFLPHPAELGERMIFIRNDAARPVATITAWFREIGEKNYPLLHWLAVKPDHQGRGLGKALTALCLQRFDERGESEAVYLCTQTWSYPAIGIYLKAGFEFVKDGDFGGRPNEYARAESILKEKLPGLV